MAATLCNNHHFPLPTKTHLKPPPKSNSKNQNFPPKIKSFFTKKTHHQTTTPIHTKNPLAIYSDIRRFADENKLKEIFAILDYLDRRGIPVNASTFSSIIRACVKLKCLKSGKLVHTHIRINGLEGNEFLQTKLVQMYAACGSIEDARKVFDEMPSRNVYTWNAFLRGNVVMGGRRYHEVLGAFSVMRELGVDLNVYSFSCLIKSFAGASALYQGFKMHALLIKNGFLSSCILTTSLIDMYFKCGKVRLAHRLFEEIGDERDVVLWGVMMAGFAHNRRQWEALDYLRWMRREGIDPNSVILTTILPVIGEVRVRRLGQEVHAYLIKTKEYSNQLTIQSGLIDMYCKCGDMTSGRKVFYGSEERNSISWTALMSGYAANGRLDQALKSITWMQHEGFKPDVVTVATILPICGKLKALRQGKEIHCYAVKNGFLSTVSVATSLMMMYSKCGLLNYSSRLFGNVESRNVVSWTAMIDSYIESGCFNEALEIFRSMLNSKHRPDSVAMARMLSVCGELGVIILGKEIHGHALKCDFDSIPFVSSEIVKMYGLCGAIDEAMVAFEKIPVKGSMTWTAIIEAYGYNGLYREALVLFKKMISGGFSPNHFTFKVALSICEQAGFGDEACQVFRLMSRKFNVEATEEHYSIIIRLLTGLGRLEEAKRFSKLRSSL